METRFLVEVLIQSIKKAPTIQRGVVFKGTMEKERERKQWTNTVRGEDTKSRRHDFVARPREVDQKGVVFKGTMEKERERKHWTNTVRGEDTKSRRHDFVARPREG
ncbi:unnamed protein product [Lactuca saligna]|uniref:Uncharacterized protein n=1 Tax=Lactuca saligna TaxID=75948 RepID=A0AA35ZVP6_LACSI|nr:unnamed protein product [Lactuca saligna]